MILIGLVKQRLETKADYYSVNFFLYRIFSFFRLIPFFYILIPRELFQTMCYSDNFEGNFATVKEKEGNIGEVLSIGNKTGERIVPLEFINQIRFSGGT